MATVTRADRVIHTVVRIVVGLIYLASAMITVYFGITLVGKILNAIRDWWHYSEVSDPDASTYFWGTLIAAIVWFVTKGVWDEQRKPGYLQAKLDKEEAEETRIKEVEASLTRKERLLTQAGAIVVIGLFIWGAAALKVWLRG